MKRSPVEMGIRLILLMIGLTVAHLGVVFFLRSNLGADPFNVAVQGLFRGLHSATGWSFLTHGRIHVAVCFLIIAALLFIDRSYVKIGTFVCMFAGGPIIDGWNALLATLLDDQESLLMRVDMLVVGCVLLAYGMSFVIESDAGTGPNDLVSVVAADKLHASFALVRVVTDAIFILLGFLLGGVAGVGTVVCMLMVGPIAGFFRPINARVIDSLLTKNNSSSQG
ncbi:YczE/YyaS/YitT family protein [Schaalia vaccimaxillae]|uniref:YczE/YyaS/YitT family protein n=1 Tax=Schaalia vaccimaxillae TaxID=183916 RepID=UPI0003B42466|nr:membrane protein [Schaalia vaccimaxillae]